MRYHLAKFVRFGWQTSLIAMAVLLVAGSARGAAITAGGSGNWSSTTVNAPWAGGVVPGSGDTVTIAGGFIVTVDISTAACSTLTLGGAAGGTLAFNANPAALTVTSTVTLAAAVGQTDTIDISNGNNPCTLMLGNFVVTNATANHVLTLGTTKTNGTIELTATGTLPAKYTVYNNLNVHSSTANTTGSTTTTMGVSITINGTISIGNASSTGSIVDTLKTNTGFAIIFTGGGAGALSSLLVVDPLHGVFNGSVGTNNYNFAITGPANMPGGSNITWRNTAVNSTGGNQTLTVVNGAIAFGTGNLVITNGTLDFNSFSAGGNNGITLGSASVQNTVPAIANTGGGGLFTLAGTTNVSYVSVGVPASGATIACNLGLGSQTRIFTVNHPTTNTADLTISGVISGTSNFGISTAPGTTVGGILVLSGANTYPGDTTIGLSTVLKLGANNVIPTGTGKGNLNVNGKLDMSTFSNQINGLIGAGTVDNVAGAGTPMLTVGDNNATGAFNTFSGIIKNTTGTLMLTKIGTGILTLSGANTYTGATAINAGTLALTASGSINATPSIAIAAGATYDVSGLTLTAYTLNSGTTLSANGTGTTLGTNAAAIKGNTTVNLGAQALALTYTPTAFTGDATHPALVVSQGALTLNNNSISVNNAGGTALGIGTYTLIQVTSGSITGAPNVAAIVNGSGIASGTTASISVSGGSVNLVVAAILLPTQLAFVPPTGSGTAGTPFSVTIVSQDSSANAQNVNANTLITLTKATGAGTLGGTLTGTIANGTSSITISGVTYDTAGTLTMTATPTSGMINLTPATSGNFTFAAATSAAMSTLSASPSSITADGFSTSTITVQARDTNGVNLTMSSGMVTISQTAGSGILSAVTDNQNGTYTATLTSPMTIGSSTFTATLGGNPVGVGSPLSVAYIDGTVLASPTGAATTTFSGIYTIQTFAAGTSSLDVITGGAIQVLAVGGGGSGGTRVSPFGGGGGGGAGGLSLSNFTTSTGNKVVVVGAGGTAASGLANTPGTSGGNSTFDTITVLGGGGGGAYLAAAQSALNGGSGGGAGRESTGSGSTGGTGTAGQGNSGGNSTGANSGAGGGGGAGAVGATAIGAGGGNGGAGISSTISGTLQFYAGGGGGGAQDTPGTGGSGVGGTGGIDNNGVGTAARSEHGQRRRRHRRGRRGGRRDRALSHAGVHSHMGRPEQRRKLEHRGQLEHDCGSKCVHYRRDLP